MPAADAITRPDPFAVKQSTVAGRRAGQRLICERRGAGGADRTNGSVHVRGASHQRHATGDLYAEGRRGEECSCIRVQRMQLLLDRIYDLLASLTYYRKGAGKYKLDRRVGFQVPSPQFKQA